MAALSELGSIAKSVISKVYEFDRTKHKLKPGEILLVRGQGKPQLVMNQAEYEKYLHNKQLGYFDQTRRQRIAGRTFDKRIDPKTNPQFEQMIRREINTGIWNPSKVKHPEMHKKWPLLSHNEKDLVRLTRFIRKVK